MADVSRHFGLNATSLQGAIGYADFLYTMADNDVIVREETVLPALEFLDTATRSAKIVCLFYSPRNGDTTVLTLYIEVEGTLIKTHVKQAFYGFLDAAQREKSVYYYAIILALCVAILALNVSLLLESNSLCKQYGTITKVKFLVVPPPKRKNLSKNAPQFCGNKGTFIPSPPPPYHSLLRAMYSLVMFVTNSTRCRSFLLQEEIVKQRLGVTQMEMRKALKKEHKAQRCVSSEKYTRYTVVS